MNDILVPTDFSTEATNAVEYAAKLAQAIKGSLTLLHVRTAEITEEAGPRASITDITLDDTAAQVTRAFKVPCSYQAVDKGNASIASTIATYADEHDLVVMGTNGAETLVQEMIGTNTWRVSKKVNTPVIAVPENITYGTIRNILYAFDYSRDEPLPMKHLLQFSKPLNAHIHLLHIGSPYYMESTEEELEDYAAKAIEVAGEEVTMSFRYAYDEDIIKGIDDYITKCNCDMLAMHTKHRNFLQVVFHRSVSKQMTSSPGYPVFIFH